MIRLLLWFLFVILVWKVITALTSRDRPAGAQKSQKTPTHQPGPPFENVEETDFEDLTNSSSQTSPGSDEIH